MNRGFMTCLLLPTLLLVLVAGSASAEPRSYPGTILACQTAKLSFRVSGPLVKIAKKPGDKVTKAELLMQIDNRDFADQIDVLEAQLAGAKAQKLKAQKDFERAQTLFEQQVSASADYDLAQSIFSSSSAGVKSLEAQLRIARHHLQDCSLLAPFDGVVTEQQVENFEMIAAGRVVMEMQDISSLEVEIRVPENEIIRYQLQRGTAAQVRLVSQPGQTIAAKLVEWQSAADPVTRSYLLRFGFKAPGEILVLPGMTAEVQL